MTAFRRRLRRHQHRWREANDHPIGSQPIAPRPGQPARPVGSRLPLDYARETGANFLTDAARTAARTRAPNTEPHQSFDHQRFWADLLWSPSLAVNLFGDLAADHALADRAVHALWPDSAGTVRDIRFAHSPARFDATYLGSLRAFDVAIVLDLGDGTNGIIGVDTKYHEWSKPEIPKPSKLPMYLSVDERSHVLRPDALERVTGRSEFAEMWLEHLLLFMLQHPSHTWSWGRYVVLHPAGNSDIADTCSRYRALLDDDSTFSTITLENALDSDALPRQIARTLQDRYIPRDEEDPDG